MNLKININKLAVVTFVSLFIPNFIGACQERQPKLTPQELLFQGVTEQDRKRGYELVQQAIDQGVDIDLKYENGNTALIKAAMYGNKEIVQLLLDAKANPDIQNDNGDTALICAASNSYEKPIEKALITKLLLYAKADPNIQNNYGYTALSRAAMQGSIQILQLLLNANANSNIQSNNGNTALMWAIRFNHKEIAELLLLNTNINPDIQNNYGNTALIMAAKKGQKEIVQLLLDINADIDIKDTKGKTALNVAQEQKRFAQIDRDAVLEKKLDEIIKILQNEQIKRRKIILEEASKYLYKDLANIVSEYFVSCPEASDKKPEKPA